MAHRHRGHKKVAKKEESGATTPEEALGELLLAVGFHSLWSDSPQRDELMRQRESIRDMTPEARAAYRPDVKGARKALFESASGAGSDPKLLDRWLAAGIEGLLSRGVRREEIDGWAQPGSLLPLAIPALLGGKRSAQAWAHAARGDTYSSTSFYVDGKTIAVDLDSGEVHDLLGRTVALALAERGLHGEADRERAAAEWFAAESDVHQGRAGERARRFGQWLLRTLLNAGAWPTPLAFLAQRAPGPHGIPDVKKTPGIWAGHADWLDEQVDGMERLTAALMAAAWAEAAKGEEALKALMGAAGARMGRSLAGVPERPDLAKEMPGWRPAGAPEPAAPADENGAQAKPKAKKLGIGAKKEALAQGAIGELAVAVAERYGVEAQDGLALVGEAKRALTEMGGWTPGAWRMAAANPELARACAQTIAAQTKALASASKQQKGADARQETRARAAQEAVAGKKAEATAEWAEELFEMRKGEGLARGARAVAALMRGASERGASPERVVALGELVEMLNEGDARQARGGRGGVQTASGRQTEEERELARARADLSHRLADLALPWLAGVNVVSIYRHQRREISGSIAEQTRAEARQAREIEATAPQWAAALLDGWMLAKKKAATPLLAMGAFERSLVDLFDCVCREEGFHGALPKKFGWENLTRIQERWHEQLNRRQHEERVRQIAERGEIAWAPVAGGWAKGDFEAVVLSRELELWEEGRAMSHCVGSYADRCAAGDSRVVSVRWRGSRVSTLQIEARDRKGNPLALPQQEDGTKKLLEKTASWAQIQHRGPHNGAVSDAKLIEFCQEYVERQNEIAAQAMEERERAARQAEERQARGESEPAEDTSAKNGAQNAAAAESADGQAPIPTQLAGLDGVREALAKRRVAEAGAAEGKAEKPQSRKKAG
jgi:hypothetical protein